MTNAIRILGLDPGLRRTGWGVVAVDGARLIHIAHGVIAPRETLAFAERLLAPARAGLAVAEYAAKVVKKAVVGTGAADKAQVAFMIARLLPTAGGPSADAADALAVAIAHAHARKRAGLARRIGAAA